MMIFRFVKTVKRAFDNKIISSCDTKFGGVVSFVFIFRGAESGVAVTARPTILHLVCRLFTSSQLCNAERGVAMLGAGWLYWVGLL